MKKEILNEVSRIKGMMMQLNENDFLDNKIENNDNQERSYSWDNRLPQGANLHREKIYNSLRDLVNDDYHIEFDEFEDEVSFISKLPHSYFENLSREERNQFIEDGRMEGEEFVNMANRGGGPYSLKVKHTYPNRIIFTF
jgi:hypothetical protein